jgi:hypothetical protein
MSELRTLGIAENTLVILMADNGPTTHNGPPGMAETLYRGGKGDYLEGGVRVPAMAWWPGVIAPGQTVGDIIHETDLFTTFARLAAATDYDQRVLRDAESSQLAHQIADPDVKPRESLLRQSAAGSHPIRKAEEGGRDRPVVDVERLFCRRILANELNSPLLHFRIEFHVVVMVWRAAKLTYRATLRAFKGENEAGRDANLHLCVGVFAEHFGVHDTGSQH